jgi:RNA polymerase sigma-70 factor (ECF subfamily)
VLFLTGPFEETDTANKSENALRDFANIYQEFQPKILRYLAHLVGENDVHDLTQAVLLKVSRSLEGFRGESSLSTWIFRIATNTAHDHLLSSLAKQREREVLFDDAGSPDELPDPVLPGTDQEYIRREMNACIRDVVDQLPENYRTVLLLSEFEEFTNPEIAEILCLSIDTVKIRLHRARAKLREALQCSCTLYRDERNELACDRKG